MQDLIKIEFIEEMLKSSEGTTMLPLPLSLSIINYCWRRECKASAVGGSVR